MERQAENEARMERQAENEARMERQAENEARINGFCSDIFNVQLVLTKYKLS